MTPMNIESSHENHGYWHDYERDMIMKISISYARTSAVLFPCIGNKIQCHIKKFVYCNGRAEDRWIFKRKDGCHSQRAHGGESIGLFMPQLKMP